MVWDLYQGIALALAMPQVFRKSGETGDRRDVYCYFAEEGEVREGCYCTLYVSGYGNDEASARLNWGVGLKLMGNAIVQLSRAR